MFNSLFTTVRLRLRRLTRTISRFQILPIKNRGYVMLLVTMVIPLLLYGVKWVLDERTILSTSRAAPQGVIFKRCAKDAALAVAKKWNPSLTLKQQKESMLRIADEVYNAAPAYSTATPTYDAIPGLEMPKKHTTTKSGAYNPVKVNVTEYTSLSPSAKTVAYKSQSTNLVRYYFYTSFGALRAPSISRYFYLIRDCRGARPSPLVTEDIFSDFYCYRRESQYDDFYITTTALQTLSKKDGSSNVGTKSYTIRSNANDSTVQVSVQDDKIKVITDSDIGYATPASCNVDIILGIPVNNATLNQNNYDTNTPTAGSPHVSTSASVTNDVKSTPIYQISRAYRTFLKNNFFYTRGVNVGVIPYSGKVSLYRDRSAWIQAPKNFVTTYFLDQNNYPAYIRGSMMYGSNGTAGGSLTSLSVATGNTTGQMESKGFKYSYGIMARGSRDVLYAGNYVNVGDLLSVAEPTNDSTKFQEVYLQPCYGGYTNLLSMQCEKNCDVCYINPFSIMEFSSDLQFTYEMLQLFYPHENKKNDSNFLFIPFTWANNLLQSWNTTGAISAVNTASDTTNFGRLSCPSKMTANRKKALILVVNKPDWFEPGELTYLGYDNDFSEIPMVEGDCIRGDINYASNSSLKFADGSQYDNTIQGAKKILKLSVVSGNFGRNGTTGWYETTTANTNATVRLTFPKKYLIKVVVEGLVNWRSLGRLCTPTKSIRSWGTIDWDGGKFLVITQGDNYVMTSTNGETWNKVTTNINVDAILGPRYGDGKWFALRYNLSSGWGDNSYISSDGKTWTAIEPSWGGSACAYGNGLFTHLNGAYNFYTSTPNLTGWSQVGNYGNDTKKQECRALGYCNGHWCAITWDGTFIVSYNNGATWSVYSTTSPGSITGSTSEWYGIIYALGRYWALTCSASGKNGLLVFSHDGKTWYKDVELASICGVSFADAQRFRAIGFNGQVFVSKSDNGYFAVGKCESSVQFPNISLSSSNCTTSGTYSVTEKREFFIEPSQITTGSDGAYYLDMNLKNIRLISAEITNRPYTKVTPTVTKSGASGSVTFTANCKCVFHVAIKKTANSATLSYTAASGTSTSQTIANNKVVEISPSTHQYIAHYDANGNPYYTIAVTTSGCSIAGVYPGTLKQFSGSASGLNIDAENGGASGNITLNGDIFPYTKTVIADSSGTATVSGNKITCPIGTVLHVKAVPNTKSGSVSFYNDNQVQDNVGTHNITETKTFTFSGPPDMWNWSSNSKDIWNVTGTDGANFGNNLSIYKVKFSTNNAKISSMTLTNQILRFRDNYNSENQSIIFNNISDRVDDSHNNNLLKLATDPCVKLLTNAPSSNLSQEAPFHISKDLYADPTCYGMTGGKLVIGVWGCAQTSGTYYLETGSNSYSSLGSGNGWGWYKVFSLSNSCYSDRTTIKIVATNVSSNSNQLDVAGLFMLNNQSKSYSASATKNDVIYNRSIGILEKDSQKWICFCGDGQLQVTVEPLINGTANTITFNTVYENTAHELWNEWNFCLEPSQMTNNGNGTQSLTYSTTGNVTVTATYEYKDRFKFELKKPTNVAQASYTISGHKKEMKWKKATLPSTAKWTGICYGGDKFVTVSQSSVNAAYSTDGIAWHASTLPSSQQWRGIGYGHGTYIAPGYSSSVAAYSQDGITWNQVTLPANRMWYAVCYGYDKFVAVAQNSNTIIYSQNGINWSTSTLPSSTDWKSICYAKDKFVAVPGAGNNRDIAAYSSNGINWTQSSLPSSQGWNSVCYGGIGKFVTVAGQQSTTTTVGAYSNDGQSWYQFTLPTSSRWASVCYGSNVFIAVSGYNASSNKAAYSVNGINWITSTLPVSAAWWEISYGNGTFVCVAGGYNTSTNTAAYTTFHDGVIWDAGNRLSISGNTNSPNSLNFSDIVDDSVQVEATNETITGISVTYLKAITPDPMIEFKKIRLPEMSRSVDFSVNNSGKPMYDPNMIAFGYDPSNNNSCNTTPTLRSTSYEYDNSLGYWVTKLESSSGAYVSGWHHYYNRGVWGDFYFLADDIGITSPLFFMFTSDGATSNVVNSRRRPGLLRSFTNFSELSPSAYGHFDLWSSTSSGPKNQLIMGGLTLPINAMLYYGAQGTTLHKYQWQSDASGKWNNLGATEAVKKVTQDACAKLKSDWGANLRVYLIKFRKQAQYKHKVTGAATNFDYTYLNNCATGTSAPYMYDISSESDLNNALSAIATDIKSWAGYQEAKNL